MKSEALPSKTYTRARPKKVKVAAGATVIDAKADLSDNFFDEFVDFARSQGDTDFIVPTSVNEPLMQVSRYIPVPPAFADLFEIPGVPCGLITEVFGPPDGGKTTFCVDVLRSTQQEGGIAVLLLTERKFSLPRAADMGVDVKKLLIRRPKTIEDVREHIHSICSLVAKSKTIGDRPVTIVWDSLAATPCRKELDESRGEFAADQAAALTSLLRKTQGMICDHNIAFVMINQISTKIGVTFGKKTQSKGGFAPKFYSAMRLEFAQIGRLRAKGDVSGTDFSAIRSNVEVIKNHLGRPFKTLEVAIDYRGFVFDRDVERKPDATDEKLHTKKKVRSTGEDES